MSSLCYILQHDCVTVELAGVFSLQDLMGWSQSDRSFFNRQDVMTRGGKGGAESNTHTEKKSSSQWLKEEYEKAKRERKNKSSIWAVPHARPSNIVPPYWDSDGWLGGSCGGQAAEELECGGGCWLASCVTALGIYLFCFCVLSHKNKRRRKIKRQ